ncbi:helix-turn-helix transcriptional regulator [Bradyrhizobium hipponense]|uniref:Helix-turn-helix transcriptional regulator n=2 Tax=Bradyrhizobium hipponense TaxID=2605638 RepID=A0A5S4YEM7_9BRAD|nr:helix-turn-helix transcriptional regulator [Bradyrhizobium hipponense]
MQANRSCVRANEKLGGVVMQRKSWASADCPMARAVDVIGDWGSLMILREAFGGVTRFDDFQKRLAMSRNLLTARLKKLVASRILVRQPIENEAWRFEYVLTDQGQDLFATIIALRQWGDRWLFRPEPAPFLMMDRVDGSELVPIKVRSSRGREITLADIKLQRRSRSPNAPAPQLSR